MKFDLLSLGDHLPDPRTGKYNETQSERHRMWVDLGVQGERLGFSGVFFGEHHCSDYILASPQLLLAAIAVQTNRFRLGTAVSLLPNNDPVRLAEDFATLDLLSQGRAEIGFGGGFTEHTFRLFGQDIEKSAAISAENLQLVQQLWNERKIDWEGKHRAPIHETELEPRTFSGRAIPISRAATSSIATAEDAGRAGHRLMLGTVFGRLANYKPMGEAYRAAYRAAGHDPAQMSVSIIGYVHVQRTTDAALNHWRPYIANYRAFTKMLSETKGVTRGILAAYEASGVDRSSTEERECDFVGDPQRVIDKIRQANDDVGGADRLLCYFDAGGISAPDTLAAMKMFSERVMPELASI